jgi:hypothetical protein
LRAIVKLSLAIEADKEAEPVLVQILEDRNEVSRSVRSSRGSFGEGRSGKRTRRQPHVASKRWLVLRKGLYQSTERLRANLQLQMASST